MKSTSIRARQATPMYRFRRWLKNFSKYKGKNKKAFFFTAFWTTAATIYLTQSGVLAQVQPQPAQQGSSSCLGFLCGPRAQLAQAPGFSQAAPLINLIFVAINLFIVTALGYTAFRAVSAHRQGEDWQVIASGIVVAVVALVAFNFLANYVFGIN